MTSDANANASTNANAKMRAAIISVVSNTLLVIGKIVAGMLSGSISIVSEGIHSGIDLIAALIAYFAVKESSKPADAIHKYGHGKIENISGTVEALLIIVAAVWIIFEAGHKLLAGGSVEQLGWGMAIMAISALVNLYVSNTLMRTAKATDSVALKADAMHLRTDIYTSVGVFIGLLGIKLTGITWLDPIAALGVAVLIIKAGIDMTKQAFFPLVDVSLPQEEEAVIVNVIESFSHEYLEFHKLRTRKAGSERHIDLHLVVPKDAPVHRVHDLCDAIEAEIKQRLPGAQVLIHIEPCDPGKCDICSTASPNCMDNQE
ncbi:MAG: cation diffusion facilitator family transporter [Peptococcaceae bacterium]|nr:cation diffusion facilitator family transporter [Peptococcaceae bacterium]